VGLELSPIAELIQTILRTPPSLSNPVNIQSLLIARHGKLAWPVFQPISQVKRIAEIRGECMYL
jgi:hypothetical protein